MFIVYEFHQNLFNRLRVMIFLKSVHLGEIYTLYSMIHNE